MFFHLTELEHHPIEFELAFAPGEIDFGTELKQTGPLAVSGKTELLRNTLGELRVRGRLSVAVESPCHRCLEDTRIDIAESFDLFYRPTPEAGTQHPEVRIEEGEEELAFYEGDGIRLEDVVREFVLLQVPMHVLCRTDCRGLCPVCGRNRNLESCECSVPKTDDRWSALRKLN